MSKYHPRPTHAFDDHDDSDEDLALDELDTFSPLAGASARRANGHRLIGNSSSGALGGNLELRSLHRSSYSSLSRQSDELGYTRPNGLHDEDTEGLLDNKGESDNTTSLEDDSGPLLSKKQRSPGGSRPKGHDRTASLSNIWSKMKSTPQSQVAEDYDPASAREITVGVRQTARYPPNLVSNAKYTPWSFLPRTLYHEFSFFLNLYFLLVALSQIVPALRIGYLSTYVAPLAFVLCVTLGKEALDDITRRRRDAEANSERYVVLAFEAKAKSGQNKSKMSTVSKAKGGSHSRLADIDEEEMSLDSSNTGQSASPVHEFTKMSRDLKVGDVLKLGKDQRVPADLVILKTSINDANESKTDDTGETFIRTDQLDGETDWKLRLAPGLSQSLVPGRLAQLVINASMPDKKVNEFIGSMTLGSSSLPLTIDNTAWANTVIASSGSVYAAVVYSGPQTRQALSTSASRSKTGLLEYELNSLTKILCALTLLLSLVLVAIEQIEYPADRQWYIGVMRYLILFSTIVPISLRVNLDLGKSVYAWFVQHDTDIPETIVRTSTIPEDLGRIEYLLSDKTGTLTQNEMQLRKIHVGTVSYANEAMSEVVSYVRQGFGLVSASNSDGKGVSSGTPKSRREIGSRVRDLVLTLALCHNVTPSTEMEGDKPVTTYQASSPDEIAIVRWTEMVGLRLVQRDRKQMVLESTHTGQVVARVSILHVFPFTSEGKRMGIILRFTGVDGGETDEDTTWFYQKGADTVMSPIVAANDWLDEETANMAREGLRTLVVGRKKLSAQQYADFSSKYRDASLSLHDRDATMARVVGDLLEQDLELLGVTGVEDKLQHDVKPSLELLRNAGVKIWMLTGDKVETARCVAISARLVGRGQYIHAITKLSRKDAAQSSLDFLQSKPDACLLIDGESLAFMLTHHRDAFITAAVRLPAVVACRCSPTQKADVALLIRAHTRKRICCIGDGGNDVSMIQAADVGIGIVGKEGRQASLAADFSITQFCHVTKLLMWHGRNSYKRSAKLSQFVIHRGLIISVCQTVFSISSRFEPVALYRDWLLVGYATVYTMMPVFSLVLDTDIPVQLAHLYPELYAELSTSRSLSYRTFFIWVAISVYQGCAVQLLSQFLTGLADFERMVSVSFTALVVNELVMVAAEVTTWHWIMIASIVATAGIYFGSLPTLGGYYDLGWVMTGAFWWRVAVVDAVALGPVYAFKLVRRTVSPPSARRVQQGL